MGAVVRHRDLYGGSAVVDAAAAADVTMLGGSSVGQATAVRFAFQWSLCHW